MVRKLAPLPCLALLPTRPSCLFLASFSPHCGADVTADGLVIKGVAADGLGRLASCGNDGLVRVTLFSGQPDEADPAAVRDWLATAAPETLQADCHPGSVVNFVQWHSTGERPRVLSTSFGHELFLHEVVGKELRQVHVFRGHVAATVQRCKQMYNALFVNNGTTILTYGEKYVPQRYCGAPRV